MRSFIVIFMLLCLFIDCFGQTPSYQKFSTYQYCFKINTDTAYQYIKDYKIPLSNYIEKTPDFIFHSKTDIKDSLPNGIFIIVKLIDLELEAKLFIQSQISPHIYNNNNRLLMQVRNMQGNLLSATVKLNKQQISYNNYLKGFEINNRKLNEKLLTIAAQNDTTIFEIEKMDKDEYDAPKPYLLQKWQRFKYSKTGNIVLWLPYKVMSIWNYKYRNKNSQKYKKAQGYILLNQPKYKLGDTVRWKAFLVNQKGKPLNQLLNVGISYYSKNTEIKKQFQSMKSQTNGSYFGSFHLADSLPNDTWVTLQLTNSGNKIVKTERFKIEDYVLDEVTNYKMKVDKNSIFKGDTITVSLSAKDANQLNILDGRVAVSLTRKHIMNLFDSTNYIPDTLFFDKKELASTGETILKIPTTQFANIEMSLLLKTIFSNSNNEQHIKEETIQYTNQNQKIVIESNKDSLLASYIVNNQSIAAQGFLELNDRLYKITFPFTSKLNHLVQDYRFYIYDSIQKKLIYENDVPNANINNIGFTRISTADTAGFILSNPQKLPVQYTLFRKGRIYRKGFFESDNFTWQKKMHKKEVYELEYKIINHDQYGGKIKNQTIALIQHILQLKIQNNDFVIPGQKDQITISVNDYKNKPVSNVNLTAVSYNNQFKKDIRIPYLPILKRYKTRQPLIFKKYIINEAVCKNITHAGNRKDWITKLKEQQNLYYQFLSTDSVIENRFQTTDSITQLSVTLISNGIPIEPSMIYIDRSLVYYKGTTMPTPQSFKVNKGYKNVWVRTYNKLYKLNKLYIAANKKNEFYFNVDQLPTQNSTVEPMPKQLTEFEMNDLNRTILVLAPHPDHSGSWVWQNDKVYYIRNYYYKNLLGPLNPYSEMSFYKPYEYKDDFTFEPGNNYKISQKKVRLEKENIFEKKYPQKLFPAYMNTLNVYDTVKSPPTVVLEAPNDVQKPFIADLATYENKAIEDAGSIFVKLPQDSLIEYYYLKPKDTLLQPVIWTNSFEKNHIKMGEYSLNLMTKKGKYLYYDKIVIKKNQLLYIDLRKHPFVNENKNFFTIDNTLQVIVADSMIQKLSYNGRFMLDSMKMEPGQKYYVGKIVDDKGNPIPYVSVQIKETNLAVRTNQNGEFSITANPTMELIFSSVGYNTSYFRLNNNQFITIVLSPASTSLQEVVVTGYASVKRRSLTGVINGTVENSLQNLPGVEFDRVLQGRAAGLTINTPDNMIQIRGNSRIGVDATPLYVVDGMIVDNIEKLDPNSFATVEVLKDAAATAIYGSRAINGVVVVTTGNQGSSLRKSFKDYAIWQPNLITDKNGRADFEVTYPDNITGWELYVLAMDKKKRIGQTSKLVTSYKPMAAQLSVPQFLLNGDIAEGVGKVVNYTNDNYSVAIFSNQEKLKDITLNSKASHITKLPLSANNKNQLVAQFSMESTTGFKDAEQRTIPILPIGTSESNGSFWILNNDTAVTYSSNHLSNEITITAMNNSIDILLSEIENIKNYPYYCMEQMASKLKALLAQKEINKYLQKPFKEDKLINKLTDKLLKAQQYDGGWNWWGSGFSNEYITYHVLSALAKLDRSPLVDNAVKNGAYYLHSQINNTHSEKQISRLLLLKELNYSTIKYDEYLKKINFDSLSLYGQWKMVYLLQKDSLPYTNLLNQLIKKKKSTILGGVFWEDKNTNWYNDANVITTLAYKVIKENKKEDELLTHIYQYFLEQKRRGYWMNTFTAINIVETILPDVLTKTSYSTIPQLKVVGDTSFTINQFPFTTKVKNKGQLQFSKNGTGLLYVTAYETYFNNAPEKNDKDFIVQTRLLQKEKEVKDLSANENSKIHLQIECTKEADYVMIELPIPAGCIYQQKKQDYRIVHTEFFKDKVVMFAEKLTIGKHDFYFELQTRYTGNYTLNPAKVSLMYYPIFYGREGLKKVKIDE